MQRSGRGIGVGGGGAGAGKERVENQGGQSLGKGGARSGRSRKRGGRGTGEEGGQVIRRGKSQGKCGWGDKRKGLGGSHGMRNARNRKTGIEIGGFPSFTPIAVVNILTKAIREKRLIWFTTRVTVQ